MAALLEKVRKIWPSFPVVHCIPLGISMSCAFDGADLAAAFVATRFPLRLVTMALPSIIESDQSDTGPAVSSDSTHTQCAPESRRGQLGVWCDLGILDCDDINDFPGHVDLFLNRFAVNECLHALVGLGRGNGIVF